MDDLESAQKLGQYCVTCQTLETYFLQRGWGECRNLKSGLLTLAHFVPDNDLCQHGRRRKTSEPTAEVWRNIHQLFHSLKPYRTFGCLVGFLRAGPLSLLRLCVCVSFDDEV